MLRYLCDPPEDGGRGMDLNTVLDQMTIWQLALFCMDKKKLQNEGPPVFHSFQEYRHWLKQKKAEKDKREGTR